jgi:hypothetical protein
LLLIAAEAIDLLVDQRLIKYNVRWHMLLAPGGARLVAQAERWVSAL